MKKLLHTFFKKVLRTVSLLIITCGLVLGAWIVFYQLDQLLEIGKPIMKEIDQYGFSRANWKEIMVLFFALLYGVLMLILTQLFLSLYEKTVKKEFDEVAEKLTRKFEIWYKK